MLAITEANLCNLDAGLWRSEHRQADRQCSMKILVVDDHFLIREALRGCLKVLESNATILEAGSGHQAMQLLSEHADIRLVLLELNLPDRDGFSVLGELRERHPAISIVVLSARQDRDSVARAACSARLQCSTGLACASSRVGAVKKMDGRLCGGRLFD